MADKKSHMITEAANPAAFAAANAIVTLGEKRNEAQEALKKEFRQRSEELDNSFQQDHREQWSIIEQALGYDEGASLNLCVDHVEHGVVFVSEDEDEAPGALDLKAGLGKALAEALGGRMGDSGVIEISADKLG